MKKTRKILKLLLALAAVVLMMSAMSLSSSAAEVKKVEVESWSQLRDALMAYNDYNPVEIKLTRDISREFDDYEDFDYGLFAVAGNKTLDLNGRTITAEVTIGEENAQYMGGNHFPYLFSFYYANSSLTIKDTSATGTGKVHYDASLVKAKNYITSPICDIFGVSYGNLTIDGGTYEVGHVRTDWTTAVYINGKLFTGNLRTQVYGTVFTVGSNANVTINGGKFIARGGQLISDTRNSSAYKGNVFKKTSTTDSYVTINGGTFYGEGGCDIFDDESMFLGIKINNGLFLTKGIDNVLFRYGGYDGGNLKKGDMHIMPEMLKPGIENKVIVNGGKNYMYASTASPQDFYNNREDTAVFTYYGFIRQTPEIPTDRVTSVIDSVPLGTSRVIAYEEKPLDLYYKVLGFDTMCSFVVRDSSNNIIATRGGTGLKEYNLASITAPGDYTITVTLDLIYDGSVVQKREHNFVVNIYKVCEHSYITISNTATCEAEGVKTERCTACGEEKITDVEALDHLSLASDWTYNSTHHWYYCRRCYTPLTIQAHSWISSTNRICSACRYNDNCEWGNAMDTEYDENYHWWPCDTHAPDESCPNNHQLERELHSIRQPSEGQIVYSCQNGYVCDGCGEYFGETGEHKWVFKNKRGDISSPSCTAKGYITYRCEYDGKYDCKGNLITCTATKKIYAPEKGHSYDFDNPVSDTATCTQEGICTYKCTRCVVTTTVISSAKGHSYSEWSVITAPTCTATGKSTATCVSCGHTETKTLKATDHTYSIAETTVTPGCTTYGKSISECTVEGCNATKEETLDPLGHDMVNVPAKAPTATEDGNIEYYDCSRCDLISSDAEGKNILDSVVVKFDGSTKPEKITATQTTSEITLSWTPVSDAAGYRVYQKAGNGWKPLGNVAKTTAILRKLTAGTKYTYAVQTIFRVDGVLTLADDYVTIDTATKSAKPSKVVATQNTSAIKLTWKACTGATGYRIHYKVGSSWKVTVSATVVTSHTFKNLKAGAKYTFAIQPYTKIGSTVIWGEYAEFTTATKPATPVAKVSSPSKGKITLTYNAVNGADGYQVYYSVNGGAYKLYKVYSAAGTLNFANLKSGTKYTFAVRAGIRTSGGNIFGGYNPVTVTVK